MSRIRTEDAIRASGNRALIGYLPVGFPDLETSVEAAVAIAEAGCTAIELGVPYSDPGMDGPVIQAATQSTLERGFRLEELFEAVAAITARTDVPVLVMTYWNPVLKYGPDAFARDLAAAGGAGLITPDLIPDEAADWLAASEAHGLDRVFLVAPSSTTQRLRLTVDATQGFVYAASLMGVTGERSTLASSAEVMAKRLKAATDKPVLIGIGVSNPEQAVEACRTADGVIVGSALVRRLLEGAGPEGAAAFVDELRAALDAG